MFEKYPWMGIAVRNGVIAGVLGPAMLLGLYYMGRHPFLIPPYFDFRIVLFAVMIFFTLREFRDFFQSGILYFWQGMFMSLVFTAVFALLAGLMIWGFAAWKPEFVTTYISLMTDQLKAIPAPIVDQIGKADYTRRLNALPGTTALDMGILYFWQTFGISFFVSIIISVILRRQPKT